MQVVVTMDNASFDPLVSTMNSLKAAMLDTYAKEFKLEAENHYDTHFNYMVVEGADDVVSRLIVTLKNKGCVDVHIYCEDKRELKWLEDEHGNLFRYCNLKFKV